jgi:P4 family phage/plasmid primase-like protien
LAVSKLDARSARAKARQKSPKQVADLILEEMAEPNCFARGQLFAGLVQGRSGLAYGYNGCYWEPASPATLKRIAYLGDIAACGTTKRSRITDIVAVLEASVYEHDLEFVRTADHEIPVRNGVVDVLVNTIRPHRKADWLDSVLPVDFDPDAVAEDFLQALKDWFANALGVADDRAEALIDFFGYVALPHARFKKALFLHGEGDSGKSVPLKLLRKFVGDEFSCSLGVDEMDDPVKRAVIKHKRLNILTELSSDAMIRDGGFKTMVSTEEPILLNPKYENPHTYVPIAKHVIAANSFPQVNDRSAATFNRLLPIPFTRVFQAHEQDEGLFARLTTPQAMSGLLNLAIVGARRVIARGGKFVTPKAGLDLAQTMKEESNPFYQFQAARLIADATGNVRAGELADEFNAWRKGGKKIDTRTIGKLARGAGLPWGDIWNQVNGGNDKGIKGWRLRVQGDGGGEDPTAGDIG